MVIFKSCTITFSNGFQYNVQGRKCELFFTADYLSKASLKRPLQDEEQKIA